MKYIARTLVVCLVAYTGIAMAIHPAFKSFVIAWIGPFPIYIFDALLVLATASFLYAIGLGIPTDSSAANRVALRIAGAYVLYQVLVIIPVAVLVFGIGAGGAYSGLNARIAVVLMPFFYYVGLRYLTAERIVAIVNAAALLLLVYGVLSYTVFGPEAAMEDGEVRLRILWGGATLMFGWLAFTGAFLQKRAFFAYSMSLAGVIGVMLVNHRSGYLALLAAFVAYVFLSRRVTRRLLVVTLLVLMGGVLLAIGSPTVRQSATFSVTTMFSARSDQTAWDRVQRSQLAWDYIKVHPLGDYVWNHQFYLVDLGNEGFEPHNFVIQALDKQGWVSSLLLFTLIGVVLWIGWSTRSTSRLAVVMTSYLVFYLVFCLFNTNFDAVENVTLFALTASLILHAHRTPTERATAGAEEAVEIEDGGRQDQPETLLA